MSRGASAVLERSAITSSDASGPQLPLNLSSEAAFRWPEAVIRFGRSESIWTKCSLHGRARLTGIAVAEAAPVVVQCLFNIVGG